MKLNKDNLRAVSSTKKRNQAGTSIVEMLIVATLLLIVVGAAVGLLRQLVTSTSIGAEKQDLEKGKETLGTIIRPDFENAGLNIESFQNHNFGTMAAAFQSNAEYQVLGDGNVARSTQNTGLITSLTEIGSETGSVQITMNGESRITLIGDQTGTCSLAVEQISQGNAYELFLQNGDTRVDLGPHQPGLTYRLGLVPYPTGKALVVTRVDSGGAGTGTELTRVTTGVPEGKIKTDIYIKNLNDRMQIHMTGAPLIQDGASTEISPSLFVDSQSNTLVNSPVYQTADGTVVLISSDLKTGQSYLKAPVSDLGSQTQIVTSVTEKQPLKIGDYSLLINDRTGKAALLHIEDLNASESNKITYTVAPVKSTDPAWNRFYSSDESLTETYSEGSRFVKISPPVTYRVSGDKRLIRQVGNDAETAAFNVQNFNFRTIPGSTSTEMQYEIAVDVAADGRQTKQSGAAPVVHYLYRATPKALNLANQSQ